MIRRGFEGNSLAETLAPSRIDPPGPLDENLREVIEGWRHRPYGYLPGVAPSSQATYVLNALAAARQKGATTFVARENGRSQALIQLEELPWDSEVLGKKVGRIGWWIDSGPDSRGTSCGQGLLRAAIEEAQSRGIRYLLARVAALDVDGAHALERNGFQLVDGLLTFGTAPPENSTADTLREGISCEPFVSADLPDLQRIAVTSFSIDRFHADPAIGREKADEVHRRWVENSCAGFADCVLVARDRAPVGFTTLKIDGASEETLGVRIGMVVLVATARECRRRGIARSLTLAALKWFREAGCRWVEVGTQLANVNASRVYQSSGFKLVNSSLTFRTLL